MEFESSDLNKVVDSYIHALFSKYPKKRFRIGAMTNVFCLLSVLPSAVGDWFLTTSVKGPQLKIGKEKTEKCLQ